MQDAYLTPRVSMGLPVYNGARLLPQALSCLLGQTLGDFELIICDNASTDETQQICVEHAARDHRIRYVRNERNLGANANFNLKMGSHFVDFAHAIERLERANAEEPQPANDSPEEPQQQSETKGVD